MQGQDHNPHRSSRPAPIIGQDASKWAPKGDPIGRDPNGWGDQPDSVPINIWVFIFLSFCLLWLPFLPDCVN